MARNGSEALSMALSHAPDLILMDIQMPLMSGFEAMERLRKNARLAAIPAIALTAMAMPGDRERCLSAGACGYITKPVRMKALKAIVDAALRLGGSGNRPLSSN